MNILKLTLIAICVGSVPAVAAITIANYESDSVPKIAHAADRLVSKLKTEPSLDMKKISVGQFSTIGRTDINNGPGIETMLRESLAKEGKLAENPIDADYEISGRYMLKESENPGINIFDKDQMTVKLMVDVINSKSGEKVNNSSFNYEVTNPQEIAKVASINGRIPTADDLEKIGIRDLASIYSSQRKELASIIKKPQFVILENQRIKSSQESPFEMELLVYPPQAKTFKRAIITTKKIPAGSPNAVTHPFVTMPLSCTYEIVLHNRSKETAAVKLSIDGVDIFYLLEDRKPNGDRIYSHYIIPAQKSVRVTGWIIRSGGADNYKKFLVVPEGKGVLSQSGIKSRSKLGIVHAQFSHCHESIPGVTKKGVGETGAGPSFTQKVKSVEYDVDPPHDFLSLRYDLPE